MASGVICRPPSAKCRGNFPQRSGRLARSKLISMADRYLPPAAQ